MKHFKTWVIGLGFLLAAQTTSATQIRNVVELKGSEQSVLNGTGVVVGLNGTGDGEFGPAHKAVLSAVMRNIDATAMPADFADADSIALVHVRAVVPAQGVRSGVDRLDVTVSAINDSESLKGGVLLDTVLFGPGVEGRAYAVASGHAVLEDEEAAPRRAKVVRGAQMVRDLPANNLDQWNRLTLVLREGNWELSNYIAQAVNGLMSPDGEPIARAVDQKNVIVQVPDAAMPNLSEFISQIMVTTIDGEVVAGGAKVIINRAEGSIVMTGDVELSPVIISHKGMTIQIVTPEPEPDPNQPVVENVAFAALDPEDRGGPRLQQLLDALNTLSVPAEDRIAIIKEIHDLNVLHAELIYR